MQLKEMFGFGRQRNIISSTGSSVPVTRLDQQYTTPGMLSRSSYDNGFAPISAISDEILKRNIHLGDVNNPETDVTSRYPFWGAMVRPNDRMGFMQFLDLLVAGFLSLEELSLLVWRNVDGEAVAGCDELFGLDEIIGFTVLSNDTKGQDVDGNELWQVNARGAGTQKYYRKDVLTLKYSLLPDDGVSGVSPGSASAQEAAIRDRLNQQQRALFDNGATPSIIVTIHARSHEEYQTIQQAYERNNRGASKQGGVVYQSVIDNQMLAGMGEPKIVITPVGTANHQLAIKEIVEFTQTTITSNYGVSPIIYGDATTTTFQNQELANSKFMERVQSILVRLWGGFENELYRLTGEILPFTFVWDDVEFDLTEEQKIKAQTNTETVKAFLALTQSGVEPSKAIKVLGLSEDWDGITITIPETAPLLNRVEPIVPLALESGCTCENKVDRHFKEAPSAQKKILKLLKELTKTIYDSKVKNATTSQIDQQIIDELIAVMGEGSTAGLSIGDNIDGIEKLLADFGGLSAESVRRLEKRAKMVLSNYKTFVADKLASLDKDDPVRLAFDKFYETHAQSRSSLISQQESKNAYQNGQLDSTDNIDRWLKKNQPQSYIVKIWKTTSAKPCPFCKAMDGTQAGIKDSFVPGGLIDGTDDTTLVLDDTYSDGSIPDAHANCLCKFEFKLVSK